MLSVLVGCASDVPPAKGPARAPGDAPRAVGGGIIFNPSLVQVGDTVAGLRVATRDVRRALDGAAVGTVGFAGTLTLTGQTMAHPDADVAMTCFEADSASAARMPRWAGDTRRAWFCFANPDEARVQLGSPPPPRTAVLTLSEFTIHYARSDVVNTARLVRADSVRDVAVRAGT